MANSISSRRTLQDKPRPAAHQLSVARRKFLSYFPQGFRDETYIERDYKWRAHCQWREALGPSTFRTLLRRGRYEEIALRALRIEGRANLIFSFEKMALRDGVRGNGAKSFAQSLYALLHGQAPLRRRFESWIETLGALPRKQTRVLTWPVATVFGFLAQPRQHLFIKPMVTKRAAAAIGLKFDYAPRPNWDSYASALKMAEELKRGLGDMHPRDMIDIQSFLWVQGSDEYPD